MNPKNIFLKFAIVGAFGMVIHYVFMIFLVTFFGIDPGISAMIGATSGATSNYWLNHRFTFQSTQQHQKALPKYIGVTSVTILLNGFLVKLLTMIEVNYIVSQICATGIIFILNFLLAKIWIYKKNTVHFTK